MVSILPKELGLVFLLSVKSRIWYYLISYSLPKTYAFWFKNLLIVSQTIECTTIYHENNVKMVAKTICLTSLVEANQAP